jgi:hypothetical protein
MIGFFGSKFKDRNKIKLQPQKAETVWSCSQFNSHSSKQDPHAIVNWTNKVCLQILSIEQVYEFLLFVCCISLLVHHKRNEQDWDVEKSPRRSNDSLGMNVVGHPTGNNCIIDSINNEQKPNNERWKFNRLKYFLILIH